MAISKILVVLTKLWLWRRGGGGIRNILQKNWHIAKNYNPIHQKILHLFTLKYKAKTNMKMERKHSLNFETLVVIGAG